MPTIGQLPVLTQVNPADEIPVSHGGTTQSVTVGALLSSTQPAIQAASGTLLGRVSLGPGGPEPVAVGVGLVLQGGSLGATGADHATYPLQPTLRPTDQAVVCSEGVPKLVELSLLRGLFSPGTNVTIDSAGTISTAASSSGGSNSITGLSTVTTIAQGDLVAISQGGADHTITYENFLDGQTIDEAQAAAAVSDSDVTWVAQGSSTMVRQSFAAIWSWIAVNLPIYKCPVIEITADTNLDTTVHNGRLLACSQPVVLTPIFANMGSGFACTVLNLSSGSVTLGSGIITSSGSSVLPAGQSCLLQGISYSAGNVVFGSMSSGVASSGLAIPGAAVDLSLGDISNSSVTLSWAAPISGGSASAYVVQYRVGGTTIWTTASSEVAATNYSVTGLQASTAYEFSVLATNAAGMGPISGVVTATTAASSVVVPGQVTGLAASSPTSNSVTLTWLAPSVGSTPMTYAVAYCPVGSSSWTTFASGVSALTITVTGLTASTSYEFEVTASNSAGAGIPSAAVQQGTSATDPSVTSIVWNVAPSGSYTAGSGSIGVNAQVTPGTSPIQFGFSTSSTVPPTSWTAATNVNTNLWGQYVPTPATAGIWYAWAEGLDGSAPTVAPASFTVT